MLRNTAKSISIRACPITQHLSQASLEIKSVMDSVLGQPVAKSVVGVGGCAIDGAQAIGRIIGIRFLSGMSKGSEN